jgi:hypothetical protein
MVAATPAVAAVVVAAVEVETRAAALAKTARLPI